MWTESSRSANGSIGEARARKMAAVVEFLVSLRPPGQLPAHSSAGPVAAGQAEP